MNIYCKICPILSGISHSLNLLKYMQTSMVLGIPQQELTLLSGIVLTIPNQVGVWMDASKIGLAGVHHKKN